VTATDVLFYLFAVCTVASAIIVVSAKSPISSAMALVATFFFLAGLYVLLWAHTVAVLQVLVYAGAVMVLFLFVIMLLSLESAPHSKPTVGRIAGGLGTFGLLAVLVVVLTRLQNVETIPGAQAQQSFGTLRRLGEILYTQWLLPFEALSLLLLVAMVGAVVVAKARI
jgi:NADH-quinone oxidoreductase subunit J